MPAVIYDVAVSADGFIAGDNDDISAFTNDDHVVNDYFARLRGYSCCLMGRRTYEFGYGFGMKPGENPYPAMQSNVVSGSIDLPADRDVTIQRRADRAALHRVIEAAPGPVYLCGGGMLAGHMLALGLIDRLVLKRAPILLGRGIRLFGTWTKPVPMRLTSTKTYDCGVVLQEFSLRARDGATQA